MKKVPSLKKHYTEVVVPAIKQSRGYKNPHQVPRILKVVLNTGIDRRARSLPSRSVVRHWKQSSLKY